MRDHPIPPVTDPLQYRAIGIVRGKYLPLDENQFTRGYLLDSEGEKVEAVVLGRVITLMRKHLSMDSSHLWVVYPRSRDVNHLHLQIVGIWEPSTLNETDLEADSQQRVIKDLNETDDELTEGDDYFSIRGELIYTRPETQDLVVRIRQKKKANGSKPIPFKLKLKGNLPFDCLRNFVSLDVRRIGQQLHLESYEVLGSVVSKQSRKVERKSTPKGNTH